jgi:hypothetical protein
MIDDYQDGRTWRRYVGRWTGQRGHPHTQSPPPCSTPPSVRSFVRPGPSIRSSWSLRQGEDTYLWISLAAAHRRFTPDEHAFAIIRRHAGNTTRSRARYVADIQPCYEKLLADGLLPNPDDVFLAHLKLLWFKTLTHSRGIGPHFEHVLASPRLLAAETRFWMANFYARLRGPSMRES